MLHRIFPRSGSGHSPIWQDAGATMSSTTDNKCLPDNKIRVAPQRNDAASAGNPRDSGPGVKRVKHEKGAHFAAKVLKEVVLGLLLARQVRNRKRAQKSELFFVDQRLCKWTGLGPV